MAFARADSTCIPSIVSFWGRIPLFFSLFWEQHYQSMFHSASVFLQVFFSLYIFWYILGYGDFCLVGLVFVVWDFLNVYVFSLIVFTILSLNIFILLFLFSFLISLPPIFSLFLLYVPCSLSIYFSYTFALKRPPKVALLWYSLPGLPWSGTIFSLCSEVCGSNTLSFAYQMGWEPALSIADYLSLEYYASVWSSEKSNTECCLREW